MKRETRNLLKTRALAMAREPEQKIGSSATMELLTFSLSTETYGIESAYVREVHPLEAFTPLPGVPSYILGLIHVRRQIMPVVDLKKFLNLPDSGLGELNKVLILHNEEMEFGILADVVYGIQTVDLKDINATPPTVTGIGEAFLTGVTKEGLIVLNASTLLGDQKMVVEEEVSSY